MCVCTVCDQSQMFSDYIVVVMTELSFDPLAMRPSLNLDVVFFGLMAT